MIDKILRFIADKMTTGDGIICIGDFLVQWGNSSMTLSANDAGTETITFKEAYASNPVVFAQSITNTAFSDNWLAGAAYIGPEDFKLTFQNRYTQRSTIVANWIAFGKKLTGGGNKLKTFLARLFKGGERRG